MPDIRVVVAEDEVLLREGVCSLLTREGFQVVGQCGNADDLLATVREQKPELALIDIRMPPAHHTEGIDAARLIQKEVPETAILVLSAHVDIHHAKQLLRGGKPIGYLLKSRIADIDIFVEATQRVVRGESVLDPVVVSELVSTSHHEDPLKALSPREHDVLVLMAEGLSNSGIAHRLFLAEATIEKHVGSILAKLRLPELGDHHRRVQAVVIYLEACRWGPPSARPSAPVPGPGGHAIGISQ